MSLLQFELNLKFHDFFAITRFIDFLRSHWVSQRYLNRNILCFLKRQFLNKKLIVRTRGRHKRESTYPDSVNSKWKILEAQTKDSENTILN